MTEDPGFGNERGLTRREMLTASLATGAALALPGAVFTDLAEAAAPKPTRGGRLRTGHVGGGTQEVINPLKINNNMDQARIMQLYDGIVSTKQGTLSPEVRLASSFEPNRTATVWQLRLKSGVEFHNGKTLTAEDVLYSFRYHADPANTSAWAVRIASIDLAQSKTVDNRTLTLIMKTPSPVLAQTLLDVPIFPSGTTDFTTPIGTGAFKYSSFTSGERSLFTRNPNYWLPGHPYVDELEMISIADNQARLNALLSKQVDAIEEVDYPQARGLRANPSVQLIIAHGTRGNDFLMRVDKKPFTDNRVRLAFKLAVDRKQMVDVALLGFGTIGNDIFGKGFETYDARVPQRPHDPEMAKALLKKAGWENLKVGIATSTAWPGQLQAATVYAQQARAAGIRIKLLQIPASDYFSSQNYTKVPFGQSYWRSPFENFVRLGLLKSSPYNETHWSDSAFDRAFLKADSTIDRKARNQAYFALERKLYDRGGYAVWGFSDYVDAASKRVKGIVPSPATGFANFDFRSWWLA